MFIESAYQFLEYLSVVKNASVHTIRNYCIDLNSLLYYLQDELLTDYEEDDLPKKIQFDGSWESRESKNDEKIPLDAITRSRIRGFLAHMHEHQISRRTVARRLSSLRTFFRWATREGKAETNPAEQIDNPKFDKNIPHPLTYEEVQRLLNLPDTQTFLGFRDRCIMELFYSSGLRVSELCAMDRADFDQDQLLVRLKGKGRKERLVPITKNAADWIYNYLEHPERHQNLDGHLSEVDEKAVFLNKLGTRLSTRSVDRMFYKYLQLSSLAGKVTPHTIRHTIATHWLENGMHLKTIQLLLGHSALSTTTIYTQVSTELKKQAYDQAHPRA